MKVPFQLCLFSLACFNVDCFIFSDLDEIYIVSFLRIYLKGSNIRAIYTGENKTRTGRINGTKQAFASYFRRDLHKTRHILEHNFWLFLFCPRFK